MTRFVWPVILVALVVALVVGLAPRSDGPLTPTERSAALSAQIRCPTCAGLSVAESESPLAVSARSEIATQVAAGQSDEQVRDYFVDRYGNTALMSPPKEGLTLYAWLAPVILAIAAVGGLVFALRRWKRQGSVSPAEPLTVTALQARITATKNEAANEDARFWITALERTESEYRTNALTNDEYEALRSQQLDNLRRIADRAEAEQRVTPKRKAHTWKFRSDRKQQRTTWALVIAAFVIVAGIGVGVSTSDRTANGTLSGGSTANVNTLLAQASSQAGASKPADAIRTYDQVLRQDPRNAEALAYRGWLIRLAGLSAQGETSVDQAIAADPTYPDARFFKGYILLRDKFDPAGAITQFDAFLANNPPAAMVQLVQQARTEAESQLSDPTRSTTTTTTAP